MPITIDLSDNPFFMRERARAMAEGLIEGRVAVLTRLLEKRFGPLPDEARNRLAKADIATLDEWAARLLDAPDLGSVLEEPRKPS